MNKLTKEFINWMEDSHGDWLQDKAEELIESESTINGEYQGGYTGVDFELYDVIEQDVIDELTSKNFDAVDFLIPFLKGWDDIDWGEVELVVGKIKKDIIKEDKYGGED